MNFSKKLSLLYVEDDDVLRKHTTVLFQRFFCNVDIAENGKVGLDMYKRYFQNNNKYYDIVVSDIQMPYLNGIELSKKIIEIKKDQKILIISAYDDKEYLIDLIHIKIDAFIQKPFSPDSILTALYDVCSSQYSKNIIDLGHKYQYNLETSTLYMDNVKIELSKNELQLLHLLITNENKVFSNIDIFNNIYFDKIEKDFSQDSVKGLIKRLRKKLYKDAIVNYKDLGYSINILS